MGAIKIFMISFISSMITSLILTQYHRKFYLISLLEYDDEYKHFVLEYIEERSEYISNFIRNRFGYLDYYIYKEKFMNNLFDNSYDIILRYAESTRNMKYYVLGNNFLMKSLSKYTNKIILSETSSIDEIIKSTYSNYRRNIL